MFVFVKGKGQIGADNKRHMKDRMNVMLTELEKCGMLRIIFMFSGCEPERGCAPERECDGNKKM